MELLLFACVLLLASDSAVADHDSATDLKIMSKFVKVIRTGDSVIYYTPAVFYLNHISGLITRCLVEDPDNCEVFHTGRFVANHILVHMEYVYLGTLEGISRCESNRKQSCTLIYKVANVLSLTIGRDHLYAGLNNGSISICNLQQPYSCRTLYTFTNRKVWSVKATDKFIYAGLDNGHLMRCSVNVESVSCTLSYNMRTHITGLTILENTIFAISWNGRLWNCSEESDAASRCVSSSINISSPRSIASFNDTLYIIKDNKEDGVYMCKWSSNPKCRNYGHHKTYCSIAFAYGTHHIQTYYKGEDTACKSLPDLLCPPYVTYYDVQQRSKLEVHVKDGRLYDAAGSLVDTTSKADGDEQSAPAIFVMAPSGRILLKYYDDLEVEFISSLLAGNPVSGAGEMVVEQGVIKKMTACSQHYLPDLKLNQQVVDSLRSQGYTEPIVSEKCREDTVADYQNQ